MSSQWKCAFEDCDDVKMRGCMGVGFDGSLEIASATVLWNLELKERHRRKEEIRIVSTDGYLSTVEYVDERQKILKCLISRDGARIGGGCAWRRQLQPRKRSRQTPRSPPP